MDNRSNEMEKINFKHKNNNSIIVEECLLKVCQPEKDLFIRTSEQPTHTVEIQEGKSFLSPIISKKELKESDKPEKSDIISNVAETPSNDVVVEVKKNKTKGKKS